MGLVGSYKPDLRNFDYAIQHVKEDFGLEKDEILIVANSKYHDVQPYVPPPPSSFPLLPLLDVQT